MHCVVFHALENWVAVVNAITVGEQQEKADLLLDRGGSSRYAFALLLLVTSEGHVPCPFRVSALCAPCSMHL